MRIERKPHLRVQGAKSHCANHMNFSEMLVLEIHLQVGSAFLFDMSENLAEVLLRQSASFFRESDGLAIAKT